MSFEFSSKNGQPLGLTKFTRKAVQPIVEFIINQIRPSQILMSDTAHTKWHAYLCHKDAVLTDLWCEVFKLAILQPPENVLRFIASNSKVEAVKGYKHFVPYL